MLNKIKVVFKIISDVVIKYRSIFIFKHKNVYIYGTNRIQNDFEYIFPKFNIKGYISDKNVKTYNQKRVYRKVSDIKDKNVLVIICCRKEEIDVSKLGLDEKKYFFVEDIAYILNDYREIFYEKLKNHFVLKHDKRLYRNIITNETMFKKMIYTDSVQHKYCVQPFRFVYIQSHGYVHCCCVRMVS